MILPQDSHWGSLEKANLPSGPDHLCQTCMKKLLAILKSLFAALHDVLFLAIFPDLEMWQFWSVDYICLVCNLYFLFWTCLKFWTRFYLSVFSNSESVLLLAFVKYMLYRHCTQNCIFLNFLEAKYFWQKIVQNLLIFVYLFCPKNSIIDFRKTMKVCLVVESWQTPHWIAFLILYRLVYNICSHFNWLILAWSA